MHEDDARRAVEVFFADAASVRPLSHGWSCWTFVVDESVVAKVPRSSTAASRLLREARAVSVVADHVDFAVPRVALDRLEGGETIASYPWIEGRPLALSDLDRVPVVRSLVAATRALHEQVPVVEVARALGVEATVDAWRQHHWAKWRDIEADLRATLQPSLFGKLVACYRRALDGPAEFTPSVVHGDLGLEHVICDGGEVVGMIDFEYCLVGDPVQDYVALGLGYERIAELFEVAALSPDWTNRVDFYSVFGPAEACAHGVRTADEALISGTIEVLALRL